MRLKIVCQFVLLALSAHGHAGETLNISKEALKARGLPESLADYFRDEPRFLPGQHQVDVVVNGQPMGAMTVEIQDSGALCLTQALIQQLRINQPSEAGSNPDSCLDPGLTFPEAKIFYRPNQDKVELVLAPERIRNAKVDQLDTLATQAPAFLLNYAVQASNSQGQQQNSRSYSADTELGVNWQRWLLRSRQSFSSSSTGSADWRSLGSYAQTSVDSISSSLQLGEISAANSLFSIPVLLGAQLFTNQGLAGLQSEGYTLRGISKTYATVEVRQMGSLVHSAMVPPGPFTLNNIMLLNGRGDLSITIKESDGETRDYVEAISPLYQHANTQSSSYSAAAGIIRKDGLYTNVVTLGYTLPLGSNNILQSGALLATQYQSLGISLNSYLGSGLSIGNNTFFSRDAVQQASGWQSTFNAGISLWDGSSLGISYGETSRQYRDLGSGTPLAGSNGNLKQRYGLSWSLNGSFGNANLGYSQSHYWQTQSNQNLNASWSKSMAKGGFVSLNLSQDNNKQLLAFISVSYPLGERRFSASLSGNRQATSANASLSESLQNGSYSINAGKKLNGSGESLGGNLQWTSHLSNINLAATAYNNSRTFSGSAIGSLAWHQGDMMAAPSRVAETFGILTVENAPGVRVEQPGGQVWTNSQGKALLTSLPAYASSRVAVVSSDLPTNVDLKHGIQQVMPSFASVSVLRAQAKNLEQRFIRVQDANGKPLPAGSAIIDDRGQLITILGPEGLAFLSGSRSEAEYLVEKNQQKCSFKLPEQTIANQEIGSVVDVPCLPANG
jgi:outer membrane usher protein FimD/PapC